MGRIGNRARIAALVLLVVLLLMLVVIAPLAAAADGTGETCEDRLTQDWTDTPSCDVQAYLPLVCWTLYDE